MHGVHDKMMHTFVGTHAESSESTQALVPGTTQVKICFHGIHTQCESLVNLQVVGTEVSVETDGDELLSLSEMVPLFTKARNRGHLAAMLVEKLVDEETRVKSNVHGRGKEKLDPAIIAYVKNFELNILFTLYLTYIGGFKKVLPVSPQ